MCEHSRDMIGTPDRVLTCTDFVTLLVVKPLVPMMLFYFGGRCWGGGNTASGIALLRRNGVAVAGGPCGITSGSEARGSGIRVRFGGGRVTRVCHRVHYYAEVGRCGATPCKPVRLCASK